MNVYVCMPLCPLLERTLPPQLCSFPHFLLFSGHIGFLHCEVLSSEIQQHIRLPCVGQWYRLVPSHHLSFPHPPLDHLQTIFGKRLLEGCKFGITTFKMPFDHIDLSNDFLQYHSATLSGVALLPKMIRYDAIWHVVSCTRPVEEFVNNRK